MMRRATVLDVKSNDYSLYDGSEILQQHYSYCNHSHKFTTGETLAAFALAS